MLDWIFNHWTDLLALYGGLVAVSSVIVKLTPSTKDNEFLDKIIKFF